MTFMERSGRMSDTWNEIDNEQTEGSKLREQLEAALKRAKSAEKELATYKNRESASVIGEFLSGKGFKPSAAKWAVKDGVDPSDTDALEQWVKDNSEDLPRLPEAGANEQAVETPTPEPEAQVDPVQAGYSDVVSQLRSSASPATANQYEAAFKEIPEDATPDQVLAIMASKGL